MSKKTETKKSVEYYQRFISVITELTAKKLSEVNPEDVTRFINALNDVAKNDSVSAAIKDECIETAEPIVWALTIFRRDAIEHVVQSQKDNIPTFEDVKLLTDMSINDTIGWMGVMQDVDIQCRAMCAALNNAEFSSDKDKTLLYSAIKTNVGVGQDVMKHIKFPQFEKLIEEIDANVFGEVIQPGT